MKRQITDEGDREQLFSHMAEQAALTAGPLFRMFGWEWSSGGDSYIPSHAAIVRCVRDLLDSTYKSASTSESGWSRQSTGRFVVEISKVEACVRLELSSEAWAEFEDDGIIHHFDGSVTPCPEQKR